jgi:hypothetical protein
VEEMRCELRSGSCVEEVQGGGGYDDDDEAEPEPMPNFTEPLCASECSHITERDQANTVNIESL